MQTGSQRQLDLATDKSVRAALILTRYYDTKKVLKSTSLEIQSSYIKTALRDVVQSYPGVNINSSRSIVINSESRCLFHYHDELRDYAEQSPDPEMYRHVAFCLRFMFKALRNEVLAFGNTMNSGTRAAALEFDYLWMAFKPGDLVLFMDDGSENVGKLTVMEER
jgi:hypothetical protein